MVKKAIDKVIEDIKEEANEDVTTFTIDRWHVLLAAAATTATLLVFIL